MTRFIPHDFPPNPVFCPDDKLFRAISAEMVDGTNVLNASIDLPAPSFNREKYGMREDVFRGRPANVNGIASVAVKTVPPQVVTDINTYLLAVVHDPLVDKKLQIENYSHAEIRFRENGRAYSRDRSIKPADEKLQETL
jgi:hypothetical protein